MTLQSLPKYATYKDSGVEWLGKIPSGWETKRVKFLFKIGRGRVISQQELDDNAIYPVYSSQTQNDGILGYISTYEFDCDQITWTTDGANAGTVFLRSGKHNCTNVCGTLQPFNKNLLNMSFLSRSLSIAAQFYKRPDTNGAKIMNGEMAAIFVTFPPLEEQTAIADFLDQKTAQIDAAIAIKEQQIALLKERKQIIIQQAVTQGLDPTVPMKDSGVEWIGQIPVHWEVKKIKYLAQIFRGKFTHRPRNDPALYDGEYPFFQTGDVARAGKYLKDFKQTLNEKGLKVSTLIPKGTVVITIAANIGDVAILDIDACFPDSVVGFSPNSEIDGDFLYYSLGNMKQQFIDSSIKNTQMNLNVERIGANSTCRPPLAEQIEIVQFIEVQSNKIDDTVILQQQQIEKLREYKTTLINSAVTGKIRVTPEMVAA